MALMYVRGEIPLPVRFPVLITPRNALLAAVTLATQRGIPVPSDLMENLNMLFSHNDAPVIYEVTKSILDAVIVPSTKS